MHLGIDKSLFFHSTTKSSYDMQLQRTTRGLRQVSSAKTRKVKCNFTGGGGEYIFMIQRSCQRCHFEYLESLCPFRTQPKPSLSRGTGWPVLAGLTRADRPGLVRTVIQFVSLYMLLFFTTSLWPILRYHHPNFFGVYSTQKWPWWPSTIALFLILLVSNFNG